MYFLCCIVVIPFRFGEGSFLSNVTVEADFLQKARYVKKRFFSKSSSSLTGLIIKCFALKESVLFLSWKSQCIINDKLKSWGFRMYYCLSRSSYLASGTVKN